MRLSKNERTVTGMAEDIEKWSIVNRLIDIENEFQQYKPFHGFEHAMYRKICEAEIAIGKTQAVNAVPVRHGQWELHGNDDDLAASFFCSLCGWNMDEDEYLDRWSHLNYCPNCGAKMDEVSE